jgi:2-C-methyl-D-erythritol 2,4-cyclodiphosphate synthase
MNQPTTPAPKQPPFAVGMGYDVHQFAKDRLLILGGVTIPAPMGLLGHSDADVLLHALCDALLGAAGLPDIGHFFPNTDEKWQGADSRLLLRESMAAVAEKGWKLGNADLVLVAEKPKIAGYIPQMKENIASDLKVTTDQIGIKATTNETMGFIGRGEGIAALGNVLLWR